MKRLSLLILPLLLAAGSAQAATLPAINDVPANTSVEIEKVHRSAEVFRHFTSECAGSVLFLGTLSDGRFLRLTLLGPSEAAAYIDNEGDRKYPWLLACDGGDRFLVEKGYGTGEAMFRLVRGRALEGIDYAVGAPVARDVPGPSDGDAFAERMAVDLASHGMDFIATMNGTRFQGRLEKSTGPCETVSIKRSSGMGESTMWFKVCSGRAYSMGGPMAMSAKAGNR